MLCDEMSPDIALIWEAGGTKEGGKKKCSWEFSHSVVTWDLGGEEYMNETIFLDGMTHCIPWCWAV